MEKGVGMQHINLVRIDDRLLHGQIGRSWVGEENIRLIIIANDEIAENIEKSKLMDIATPLGCESIFIKVGDLVNKLKDNDLKDILILVDSPKDLKRLIENGLDIKECNLGNMKNGNQKIKIRDEIFLTKEEINTLKEIKDMGIDLDIRVLPTDIQTDFNY